MEEFLVIVFCGLAFVWVLYDTRRRRGLHKALNILLLIMLGLWLLLWSLPLVAEAYTWWATHRIEPDEIYLARPARLVEGPDGMVLRLDLRNSSPAHTLDAVRLGVRLLDCPEFQASWRCTEVLEREIAMGISARPGANSGPVDRPFAVPAGFHIREHLVVEVTVLGVRNRK